MKNNKIVALWPQWSNSHLVADKIITPNSGIENNLITVPEQVVNTVRQYAWNAIAASLWNLYVINETPNNLAWIIPVHNTYWKTVNLAPEAVYQLMRNNTIHSIWWYSLKVKYLLACREWTTIENLKTIHSHTQAISQCLNEWIARLDKDVELVNEQSTTTYIPYLQEWDSVICNKQAALSSNLTILDENFWPEENTTDFIVLSVNEEIEWLQNLINNKTMIILSLEDKIWSLNRGLTLLSEAWIDMNSIHSQTQSPWNTDFIIVSNNNIDWKSVSKDLKKQWWKIKIL